MWCHAQEKCGLQMSTEMTNVMLSIDGKKMNPIMSYECLLINRSRKCNFDFD